KPCRRRQVDLHPFDDVARCDFQDPRWASADLLLCPASALLRAANCATNSAVVFRSGSLAHHSLAKGILMNHENPIVAFARDFSGDDAAIMTQVKSWVVAPPTDARAIGFHG